MELQRIIEIDLSRCFKGLIRGHRFLALMTAVGLLAGILGAVFAVENQDLYDANATVYSIAYGSFSDSEKGISAIRTYSDIIKSYKVAERAALLLGDDSISRDEIYKMIKIDDRVIAGTTYVYENLSTVINIHAEYTQKDTAIRVANAVADAFVLEVNSISEADSIQVLDYANSVEKSYNALRCQLICIAFGALGGLALGCCVILYSIIFSKKIVSVNEASMYGKLNVVGVIPRF